MPRERNAPLRWAMLTLLSLQAFGRCFISSGMWLLSQLMTIGGGVAHPVCPCCCEDITHELRLQRTLQEGIP